ncbi:MAG: PAS domain-containing protein [Actinobacteria bacterium]|nr:PAS domain-containing protein [Actinomycetota bacterium]
MERIDLIPELETLEAGSHLCHLYGTEEERYDVLMNFACMGLAKGEKVICVGDDASRREILAGLEKIGLDPAENVASGQLVFLSSREVFAAGGRFDAERMLAFWNRAAEEALMEGWPALRATCEMSWLLEKPPGWREHPAYEAEMNRLPRAGLCTFLFQYNQSSFDALRKLELLSTHPQVILGRKVYDNIYYVPPEEFLREETAESRLQNHLQRISERRHATEEIQAARQFSEAVVETVREPLVVLDPGLKVVKANRSFYRVFQVDAEETLGKPLYELGNRQWDIPELRRLLEDILPLNTSFEGFEVEHDFEHIGRRQMLLNARRIYRKGNRTETILLAIEDVTERRRAEERSRALGRLFLSMGADFLANMEGVIETCRRLLSADLAAYARHEGGKLSLLTTAAGEEGLFFFDRPRDFAGWTLFEDGAAGNPFFRAEGAEGALPTDPLAARHGFRYFLGFPVFECSSTRQDAPIGVLCVYNREGRAWGDEDLETLETLARTLQIEEERLAREKRLKDFIDIASHELRHPVTVIKGYALTLRERLGELSGDQLSEMLTAIDRGSDRLTRLVEDLLDASKLERGRLQLQREETELLPLVRQAIEELRLPQERIELRGKTDSGVCLLDRDRVLEVLVILLENALKFSPPESVVEIEVEQSEGGCLISVLDRGPGIPSRDRERVFDRFHQVEQARFHSKPGMGMGLYIAREIVERHGGRIWYEPREGGGSIFRFSLPG